MINVFGLVAPVLCILLFIENPFYSRTNYWKDGNHVYNVYTVIVSIAVMKCVTTHRKRDAHRRKDGVLLIANKDIALSWFRDLYLYLSQWVTENDSNLCFLTFKISTIFGIVLACVYNSPFSKVVFLGRPFCSPQLLHLVCWYALIWWPSQPWAWIQRDRRSDCNKV